MKIWSVGVLSLTLAVCVSSALVAQEDGRGRGRGGPGQGGGRGFGGGFGGGMGMGMSGGALELLGLLRMEEVQKDIGMKPENYQTIQAALPDMRAIFQADEGERAAKLKEANAKAKDVLDEALSPKQQERLLGLLVQNQGMRAVTNELVAEKIGLDSAKTQEIQDALTKSREEMGAKMREAFAGGGDGDRQEKMREMMEQMRKDVDQAVAAKLSDKQKADLEALKGEAFTFPERPAFGGRGPGAGGRGPGLGAGGGPNEGGRGPGNRRNRGGESNN